VNAIHNDDPMEFQPTVARSLVRIVEAADRSIQAGGREVSLDHSDIGRQLTVRRELAAV